MLDRRTLLARTASSAGTALLARAPWISRRPSDRPDILLVVLDDVGWPEVDADHVPLAALRGLLESSRILRGAYGFPLGAPTIYSAYTGRYPERDGLVTSFPYWGTPTGATAMLSPERLALPRLLSAAGYATGLFGKWNLGRALEGKRSETPLASAFDVWRAGVPTNVDAGGGVGYKDWVRVEDGDERRDRSYQTTALRDAFTAWWEKTRGPRFAVCHFQAAHAPLHQPPQELLPQAWPDLQPAQRFWKLDGFEGQRLKKRWPERKRYLALLQTVSTCLEPMLAAVGPDTIVVLTSDNGTPGKVAALDRDDEKLKGTTFDGGIHVPLAFRVPGLASGTSEELASSVDLCATLLELAGVDRGEEARDSRSLLPLLERNEPVREWIYTASRRSRALRTKTHKLRVTEDGNEVYEVERLPSEKRPMSPKRKQLAALEEELASLLAGVL